MFQGDQVPEEFFNVGKIKTISSELATLRKAECFVVVRAWDLAAIVKFSSVTKLYKTLHFEIEKTVEEQ